MPSAVDTYVEFRGMLPWYSRNRSQLEGERTSRISLAPHVARYQATMGSTSGSRLAVKAHVEMRASVRKSRRGSEGGLCVASDLRVPLRSSVLPRKVLASVVVSEPVASCDCCWAFRVARLCQKAWRLENPRRQEAYAGVVAALARLGLRVEALRRTRRC